ncbi:cytochrome P450 [Lophiotrema nucula]|uniref:Cytochrome P450 n=1 Tax=Lophiotrema nucula TaxID=690887 RepID=A0A6A5YQS2_9PLEO|nr:cytochrome P450 [Lophiotrema nucula]
MSLVICVRRIWFHPLSKYPGPKLWAATRIPYVISLLQGSLNRDMLELHRRYGDIIRLAPDELSFATEDAWRDIYLHRPGHKEPKKDPTWYIAPNDMPQNIVTTTDINHIEYLDAIINEALRLYYAIPGGLPRIALEGGDIYVGHFVPAGTKIAIRPYVVLHSEKYFKHAWDFVPERWLPEGQRPEQYASDRLSASQPFNFGPTNCIGKPLAWAKMRVLIARVV